MELQTTLNNTTVTVEFDVDFDEVDCFDRGTGRDYTDTVMTVTIEAVMFKGVDILAVISDADVTALEMACTESYDKPKYKPMFGRDGKKISDALTEQFNRTYAA